MKKCFKDLSEGFLEDFCKVCLKEYNNWKTLGVIRTSVYLCFMVSDAFVLPYAQVKKTPYVLFIPVCTFSFCPLPLFSLAEDSTWMSVLQMPNTS